MADEKILVVEMEGVKASDIKRILTSLGYQVQPIVSGVEESFNEAVKTMPDLILIDIKYNEASDGIELLSKIKELNIPLIFITTPSETPKKDKFKINDTYGYIFKPFNPTEIHYAVDLAIYKHKIGNKLKENENKFYLLFKNSPLPYQSLDEKGNFLDVNPAWLECLGYSKDEVIGENFAEFLAPKYSEHFQRNFPLFKEAGEIHGVEFEMKRKDGTHIFVSYEGKIGYDEIGTFKQTHCIFQDISEKKTAQERINKLYHLYVTISQINQAIVRIKDKNELFQTICNICVEYGKFEMAWIGLVNTKTGNIKPVAYFGNEDGYLEKIALNIKEIPSLNKLSTITIDQDEFSINVNIEKNLDQRWREEALKRNYRSLSSIPLKEGEKLVGILNIYSSKPNFFVEEEIDLVKEMGLDISFALTSMETENNKKLTEKALQKSEKNYRELVDNSLVGIYKTNLDGEILFANDSMAKILHYETVVELKKVNVKNIYKGDLDRNQFINKLQKAHNIPDYELELIGKDGQTVDVLVSAHLDGDVLTGMFMDITDRKQSEERFSSIFESDPDYIMLLGLDGAILDVNATAEQVNGSSKDDLVGKHFNELKIFPKEDLDLHNQMFLRLLKNGDITPYESRIIDKDGKFHWVKNVLTTIKREDVPSYFLVISTDITELKNNEEALKENQRILETLISNLPGVAYKCQNDPQWTMEFVSDGFYGLTGYQPKEIIRNKKISYKDLIHPDDRQMVWDTIQKSLNKQIPFKIVYRIITKDLRNKYVWEQGTGIFSSEGKLLALEGFITDVTDRVLNEERIKESESYYRTMFENTGTATIIIEKDMTISQINSEAEKLSGYSKNEIEYHKKWTDFIVKEDLERLNKYYFSRRVLESPPRKYETKFINKNGEIKDIFVTIATIPGTVKQLASILDITENKKAEKDLQGSLNEKDILMKEIHHRVKNNMQIVSSLLNLQTQYVDGDESQNVLKESQGRVKTMAMIHEKLYQSNDFTHIKFDDYIERLVSDIFYSYNIKKERIKHVIHVEEVNLNIETAIPCGLIINELISNCLKYAFPENRHGEIYLSLKRSEEKYELIITDNGIGFPESIDFKNTESLGLQLVNNLVDQIDGEISLDASHGTKFRIIFTELKYKERI